MKPKIRFKGFESPFETYHLGEVCEINPRSEIPNKFEYVDLESVVGVEMISHRTEYKYSAPSRAQRLAKEGDIFYQTVRPYQKNNYLFRKKDGREYVFSTGYAQLRTKRIYPDYLFGLMQSNNFVNDILYRCTGTSYPAINPTELSNTIINIAPSSTEQKEIASYFTHLDAIINSSAARLASLKQVKAASLQAMFPQEGETVPRLRFKGFEGEWKEVKLSDCLTIRNEYNTNNEYSKKDVLSVSDDFGICNQIELLGRSYAGKSVSNYGIVKTGDIVYTKSPLKIKKYGIIKANHGKTGIVSVLYAIYMPNNDICSTFIEQYFELAERLNNYIRPLVNKGAKNTMNISDETALQGNIMIPKYEEQKLIASYFTSIDNQITLQTQRLEKLKQIKAACLNKMFV